MLCVEFVAAATAATAITVVISTAYIDCIYTSKTTKIKSELFAFVDSPMKKFSMLIESKWQENEKKSYTQNTHNTHKEEKAQ